MGAIVGHYLQKFKGASDVPKAFAALGWIIAFSFGFYSVVSPTHMALRDYTYDVNEAAKYAAVSPVAWSIALAWFISACHLGFGGTIRLLLATKLKYHFININ